MARRLFEHVGEHQGLAAALLCGGRSEPAAQLRGMLVSKLADQPPLLAQAFAGAVVATLTWWLTEAPGRAASSVAEEFCGYWGPSW